MNGNRTLIKEAQQIRKKRFKQSDEIFIKRFLNLFSLLQSSLRIFLKRIQVTFQLS